MLVWTAQEKSEFLLLAVILYALGLVFLRQGNPFSEKQKELEKVNWISGNERLILFQKIFKNKTPSFLQSCGKKRVFKICSEA